MRTIIDKGEILWKNSKHWEWGKKFKYIWWFLSPTGSTKKIPAHDLNIFKQNADQMKKKKTIK